MSPRITLIAATTLVADIYTTYDNVGNVTSILAVDHAAATIDQFKYVYDSANRLSSETDTQNGAATTTSYTYDDAGQLTGAGTLSYGYDNNGNRNTGSDTVTTGNQMSADASWTYKYDNNGNLTEKDAISSAASWTYAYNSTNELTEVKQYNTFGSIVKTVDYKYDAFGDMIEQLVTPIGKTATTALFAYDGWNPNLPTPIGNENMNVWAVTDGSGSLQTQYVWGNKVDEQLGRVDIGGKTVTRWTLTDHLGSIRDVIDNTGVVQDYIEYDAYGNITAEKSATNRGRYAWTGQIQDPVTLLQNNHVRWYDASMGRWISRDPLGFDAGDSNLYRYVNNAPTYATDPSGMKVAEFPVDTERLFDTWAKWGIKSILPDLQPPQIGGGKLAKWVGENVKKAGNSPSVGGLVLTLEAILSRKIGATVVLQDEIGGDGKYKIKGLELTRTGKFKDEFDVSDLGWDLFQNKILKISYDINVKLITGRLDNSANPPTIDATLEVTVDWKILAFSGKDIARESFKVTGDKDPAKAKVEITKAWEFENPVPKKMK